MYGSVVRRTFCSLEQPVPHFPQENAMDGTTNIIIVSPTPLPKPKSNAGYQLPAQCLRCRQAWSEVEHHGRGLCRTCYVYAQREDSLEDYPVLSMSSEAALEIWEAAKSAGIPQKELAAAMGVKLTSFQKNIARAKARRRS